MSPEHLAPAPPSSPVMESEAGQFSKEVIAAMAVAGLGFVAVFLSGVATARALGADGKGTVSLFLTTVAGLSALSGLGIGQGQMYYAAKDSAKLRFFLTHGMMLSLVLGGVCTLLYLLLGPHIGQGAVVKHLGPAGTLAVLVAVPATSLLTFQRQYLLTVGRYTLAKGVGAIAGAAPLIVLAVVAPMPGPVTVNSVVIGVVAVFLLLAALFPMLIRTGQPALGTFSFTHLREAASYGIRLWAGEMAHFLTGRLDFFLVAAVLGSMGLGLYSVAVGLAEIVSRMAYELGTIIFPAVAAGSLRRGQAPAMLRTTLALAAGMAVVLMIAAEPITAGLYGAAFIDAARPLRVLLLGTVAWSAVQLLWLYASGAGRLGYVLAVLAGAAASDVLLNILLLPRLDILGAAVAASTSYVVAGAALLVLFCRRESCTLGEALIVRPEDLRRLTIRLRELPGRLRTTGRTSRRSL